MVGAEIASAAGNSRERPLAGRISAKRRIAGTFLRPASLQSISLRPTPDHSAPAGAAATRPIATGRNTVGASDTSTDAAHNIGTGAERATVASSVRLPLATGRRRAASARTDRFAAGAIEGSRVGRHRPTEPSGGP